MNGYEQAINKKLAQHGRVPMKNWDWETATKTEKLLNLRVLTVALNELKRELRVPEPKPDEDN